MSVTTADRDLDAEPPELSVTARNLAFAVIAASMLLAALDSTVVSTALPTIVGDLGGAAHMSWVVTAFFLAEAVATALAGKFGDLFSAARPCSWSASASSRSPRCSPGPRRT